MIISTLFDKKEWSCIQRRFFLTSREVQIAKHTCRELSHKEIAKKLGMAPGTIKVHLRNIYRTMHIKSQMAMLLKFLKYIRSFESRRK